MSVLCLDFRPLLLHCPSTILSRPFVFSATSLQTAGSIVLYSIDKSLHVLAWIVCCLFTEQTTESGLKVYKRLLGVLDLLESCSLLHFVSLSCCLALFPITAVWQKLKVAVKLNLIRTLVFWGILKSLLLPLKPKKPFWLLNAGCTLAAKKFNALVFSAHALYWHLKLFHHVFLYSQVHGGLQQRSGELKIGMKMWVFPCCSSLVPSIPKWCFRDRKWIWFYPSKFTLKILTQNFYIQNSVLSQNISHMLYEGDWAWTGLSGTRLWRGQVHLCKSNVWLSDLSQEAMVVG